MAASSTTNGATVLSPRLKNRENAKDTLCRNVTIYGKCRYEDKGCAFNHDISTAGGSPPSSESNMKKTFNVDSPSFTPSFLTPNDGRKAPSISPKAASAAPFMPKSVSRASAIATPPHVGTPDWTMAAAVQEFVPRQLEPATDHAIVPAASYETFNIPQANPYADQGLNGSSYFHQNNAGFHQPVQYHQYAPIGPYSSNMLPYQRTVHDLFLSNDFREELQKKSAAALQTLPNSQLPAHIESYHSLVPLDTTHQKSSVIFGGYSSWIYKAQSSSNGQYYALRRIEGFRLTNEQAIRSAHAWKNLICANIVRTVDCFTNRGFGDSSLFFVTDYHPLSKTLAEHHHIGQSRPARGRNHHEPVPEAILWTYIVQIASALKAIHGNGLAARILDPSKILLTGKNRVRLNGCGVLDVVQFEAQIPLTQLQRQDLISFGLVILSIGSNMTDVSQQNFARAMDQFKRYYKPDLQTAVVWLYSAAQHLDRNVDQFITHISAQMTTAFDAALHSDDSILSDFSREVENGRLFRLMAKLNFVTDTPGLGGDSQWPEHGERFFLTLFRDYVFHQVDAQNHPVVDLGHVLTSLNKLDAGSDERITLISRDEQSCFIVSYKELKKGVESAFSDLTKTRRLH